MRQNLKTLSRRPNTQVAVSLGTGSILLVGIAANGTDESLRDLTTTTTTTDDTTTINKSSTSSSCYTSFDNIKNDKSCYNFTHGLVQMRTLEHDEASMDTQETSCYVLEDTSDDSNYETVEIELLQSDNSIQEKIDDTINNNSNDDNINNSSLEIKPMTLPPPRESSLTETFGKRMKMLRRTWSMTKVSLGRIRKKTMNDNDNITNDYTINDNIKLKTSQVFNLKKHFQRSLSSKSSLSKFYLDNDYVDDMTNLKNNNFYSNEEIYESNNWFNRSGSWKNNSLRKNQESCSDDYNMLAEEPLYQYYAAAKVHGEFQINSDDYDEDDDDDEDDYSTSLPQTLDMGTLAHRTLWCETSQVLQSDILDKLTPEEKKIQEAKFEIITSEASYLNSLRVLVTEFMINHKLVHEDLSPHERDKLFGQVPNVLIASENFLSELEKIWNNDIMLNGLPQIILQHADKCCKNYIDYCSNQVYIDTTLKSLKIKKNSTFIDNVMKIESHPACQSLSLHSFLMLPLQRITRLPLLADAVLSKLSTDHIEREDWEKVLAVLGKIVRDCNEAARNTGRIVDIENLSKKLEYSSKIIPIDLTGRYLVRSGCVKTILSKTGTDYVLTFRKKYQKTILHIFLLNDYILITKIKTNDCYIVIDACKRCLIELEKVQDETQFTGKYSMILTLLENHCGKHVEYILSCDNQTERERWLDAMSPPKSNLLGETLYETWDCPQVVTLHSYSPNQPDELSFQPGEVIKVLRKLPDGWYEGEKLVGDEKGWFPGNYTKEVPSEHVRAKNLRQQHRFLALSHAFTQQLNNPNR
ncbi:ephexin-1 [Aphidius gifuensis]|uniref:ephexin-1 n=1 Tax=Aphidius gifuensis TaxID=684658 RepID=UPI001CDD6B5B|nr:ephexin-1 [Aphidius gifuensis]